MMLSKLERLSISTVYADADAPVDKAPTAASSCDHVEESNLGVGALAYRTHPNQ
jgi:hypothetical protein